MAWKKGEVYRCPDPNCGCEVGWRRSPSLGWRRSGTDLLLRQDHDEVEQPDKQEDRRWIA